MGTLPSLPDLVAVEGEAGGVEVGFESLLRLAQHVVGVDYQVFQLVVGLVIVL